MNHLREVLDSLATGKVLCDRRISPESSKVLLDVVKLHGPRALQRVRAKRGKAPLFSYWTLQLNGREVAGPVLGGTHASPRVHVRRRHPREFAPGKWTMVRACAVGNPALGIVHKDYAAGPGLGAVGEASP